jgi:hypothetical protein
MKKRFEIEWPEHLGEDFITTEELWALIYGSGLVGDRELNVREILPEPQPHIYRRGQEVGCSTGTGQLIIHPEEEVCEICSPGYA